MSQRIGAMESDPKKDFCSKDSKTIFNGLSQANGLAITIALPNAPIREKWGKGVEFMLSCIAYSVGFGNIWKFPYTALENGGGAFLIPYLVVLFIIGRPIYYLEMVLGQFCSRGCVKIYDMAPIMRGVGVGQSVAMFVVMTYYTPILAITLHYLISSFNSELPWSKCDPSWSQCIDSQYIGYVNTSDPKMQNLNVSAELYFAKTVMHRAPLENGFGMPDLNLTVCLLMSWLVVAVILIKGIRSTGKAAYFLALFPYAIILILFIHTCTLDGARNGIMFFLTPKWDQLFTARVWMEAVTQCFFSLSICFGGIIAYSSFNRFSNNVYRDAMIISWLDTFTSIIVGCIVFGVLGNLAHVTKKDSIVQVVKHGPGLTFAAYPDAIAKFEYFPQLFSVLFFLMLFIVGIGSNLGVITSIVTAIRDSCPSLQNWKVASTISVIGFCLSTIYLAPGGIDLLNVFDTYGAKYVTLTLALFELITFAWIYGVDRICRDIRFMLNIETSYFWRICWAIVAPVVVAMILIGCFIDHKPENVPWEYNAIGWSVFTLAVVQVPLWAIYAICTQKQTGFFKKIVSRIEPSVLNCLSTNSEDDSATSENSREKWGKNIEFLLSCVALSVGFGNIWRFPYTALQNGGGAFVIPYLIVLFVVGRPLYYLEMVVGQFSSRGCVKVFDISPLMRGIGVGQTVTMFMIVGFYAAVLAIAVRYFVNSFQDPLPWSFCQPEWPACVDSSLPEKAVFENGTAIPSTPSAAFYFDKTIMHTLPNIDNGIGVPDWKLALCLLACWICITGLLIKGIKSSGKASYFLAIFPYVILLILLIRACTLKGAGDGIMLFFTPQWEKLIDPTVWYAAVTQCFFSLTIGLGAVIVFSSFNSFSSNIYRDAMIISWLDTCTSMISGVIVFGIVGNVANTTGKNITEVIQAGPALTFITYPDAIAKMTFAPQFFAVMFFLMFILLGLGSNMGIVTTILTSIRDRYPQVPTWKAVLVIGVAGFFTGLVYITPGGLTVLGVVNDYGVEFATLTLVILEVITFCWIYGVNRLCVDIHFMLGIKTGIFWRVCWGFLTLFIIGAIFILKAYEFKPMEVPVGYNVFGWCLYAFTVLQVVGWAVYAILKRPEKRVASKIIHAIKPTDDWGPETATLRRDYNVAMRRYKDSISGSNNVAVRVYRRIFK